MNVLAVDTSTPACVLGLRTDESTWVDETVLGRSHSLELLPRIDALIAQSGIDKSSLDLIVYGQGPGSFTGLRIGVGVVQGLAFGLNIETVGVSSLACLAQGCLREFGHTSAIVALTARNQEVYFGAYRQRDGYMQLIGVEGVHEAAEIPAQDASTEAWVGVGSGWQLEESLTTASGVPIGGVFLHDQPKAQDLLDLGMYAAQAEGTKPAEQALPRYLREQVAVKSSKK